MGKSEEEQAGLPVSDDSGGGQNGGSRLGCCCFGFRGIRRLIGIRCVLVLFMSVAVFLSAIFWLPPFLQFSDQGGLDLDHRLKDHDIVSSFRVQKPVPVLEDNISKLEDDIFEELSVPNTKVVVLYLEPLAGSTITTVVFAVDPATKYLKLSSTDQSLVSAYFKDLVVNVSSLSVTESLFGDPFAFEVLKFPGGITIVPPQSAFLLQKVLSFNFTLNFSIYQIRENFLELTSQLRAGLHLTAHENLYIRLSNAKGSTVAPPTTVESSVLLAIGNPSMPRLKQLAQTISGHAKNLGLNNTVFGRVKQVSLSSVLQHSLHGGEGAPAPSPVPLPYPPHNHHHHHHHHHHSHHNTYLVPALSPAPAPAPERTPATHRGAPAPVDASPAPSRSSPAPEKSNKAKPPGCELGPKKRYPGNGIKQPHVAPTVAPDSSPFISVPPQHRRTVPHAAQPTPAPISNTVPSSSPLPNVVFARTQPPSNSKSNKNSDAAPSVAPSPFSSSAVVCTVRWPILLSLALVLHL